MSAGKLTQKTSSIQLRRVYYSRTKRHCWTLHPLHEVESSSSLPLKWLCFLWGIRRRDSCCSTKQPGTVRGRHVEYSAFLSGVHKANCEEANFEEAELDCEVLSPCLMRVQRLTSSIKYCGSALYELHFKCISCPRLVPCTREVAYPRGRCNFGDWLREAIPVGSASQYLGDCHQQVYTQVLSSLPIHTTESKLRAHAKQTT